MRISQLAIILATTNLGLARVSPQGTCGKDAGYTCSGSSFGNCCSQHGWCGSTDAYCGTGCQSGYGTCSTTKSSSVKSSSTTTKTSAVKTSSTSAASPTSTLKVSQNGKCGSGVTCVGSSYGNCCSEWGYCGSDSTYCSSGCQSAFGTCTTTSPGDVSTDATCGGTKEYNCVGSSFGNCCSKWGFCGSTSDYCGTGCQSGFGTCNAVSSSSSVHSSTSTQSSTFSTVVSTSSSTQSSASSTLLTSSSTSASSSALTSSSSSAATSSTSSSSSTLSSSTSTSLSTSTSTSSSSSSTSTSISTSTSTSTSSSSSSSAAASATCATNLASNGGLENTLSPWSQAIVNGAASGTFRTGSAYVAGPKDGTYFYQLSTSSSPIITLSQTLTGVTAGTILQCNGYYQYAGDQDGNDETVYVTMLLDGQTCGSAYSTETDDWTAFGYQSSSFTVSVDNPVVQVSFYFGNDYGDILVGALDAISVTYASQAGLPVCS